MAETMNQVPHDSVHGFYKDQDIFITGATGFVGKVVVEKLLRSCPDLRGIYMLMRPKRGKIGNDRIKVLTDSNLFDSVRAKNPELFNKLHAINGDCMEMRLGISDEDFERMKQCSIVLHVAASVRFDDAVKKAILMNTRGTEEICKLALQLPNLKSVVHVSTTYCNPFQSRVQEEVYPNKNDWRTYIRFAETYDQELLDCFAPHLINFFPNTYTFTKKLAENVCKDYKYETGLPITILRPSIITSTEVEPCPGWIDNFNGPVGLGIAGATGIKRVMNGSPATEFDFIPVDICGKAIIVAAWKEWKDGATNREIKVYNCANLKKIAISLFIEIGVVSREMVHFKNCIWVPWNTVSQCKFMQYIRCIFYQWLPALLIDTLLYCTSGKTMLIKLHRKLLLADQALHYFTSHSYDFINTNFTNLNKDLIELDSKDFFLNERIPDIVDYTKMSMVYAIKHLLKTSPEDEKVGEKRYKVIKKLQKISNIVLGLSKVFIVWKIVNFFFF